MITAQEELRLEALKLAAQACGGILPPNVQLLAAKAFHDFLCGKPLNINKTVRKAKRELKGQKKLSTTTKTR